MTRNDDAVGVDGTLALVGAPEKPLSLNAFSPMTGRRRVAGSYLGSIREMRAMLDFCAEHGIVADIERMPLRPVDSAFSRLEKGDVRYRFVVPDVGAHFAKGGS